MTQVAPIPDLEAALHEWLAAHPAFVALGLPLVPRTPDATDTGWVRLRQLEASADPRSRAERLTAFMIQFDCYAGEHTNPDDAQAEASFAARVVRAALQGADEPPGTITADVVVTGVVITGHTHRPDHDFAPERERYILTVDVYAHPV